MRHLLPVWVLLALPTSTFAQDALDKIAQHACGCVAGLTEVADQDERNTQMGLCMLSEASKYEKELKKKHGFDLSKIDQEGEALGRAVGFRMAKHCPDVLMKMVDASEKQTATGTTSSTEKTMVGKLTEVRRGEFLTLVVRSETGSTYELLVLGPVANGGALLENVDGAVGRSMAWSFEESELFDVRSGAFRNFKVLRSIPQ